MMIDLDLDPRRLGQNLARRAMGAIPTSGRAAVRKRLLALADDLDHDIRPRATVRLLPAAMVDADTLRLCGTTDLSGSFVHRFAGADQLAVVFASLGQRLADRAHGCAERGEMVEAALLDQVGSRAVWQLGQRLLAAVRLAAMRDGSRAGGPLFPGDPGLPLSTQSVLAQLGDPRGAGVAVGSGGLLTPLKSLSMVVAIGPAVRRWSRASNCRYCRFFERCRKQREGRKVCP
jgi:hypothetical protein